MFLLYRSVIIYFILIYLASWLFNFCLFVTSINFFSKNVITMEVGGCGPVLTLFRK